MQQVLVVWELRYDRIPLQAIGRHRPVLAQNVQCGDKVPGIGVALQWLSRERSALRKSARL